MFVAFVVLVDARHVDRLPEPRVESFSVAGAPCDVGDHDNNMGLYAPNPANCSEYLQCEHGFFRVSACDDGLYWDADEGACQWPHLANCNVGLTAALRLAVETDEDAVVRPRATECPTVDPMDYTVFLPHNSCTHYYACSNGLAIEMECPDALEWNRDEDTCDWAWDAACVANTGVTP